ncbi:MAG: molybdenum cofactor biosynthesis protein MoaE [Bacteroidota bacterium]
MTDIQIFDTTLNPATCIQLAGNSASGGNTAFIGTVRDQTKGKRVVRLEFEAYKPMAISEMQKIANKVTERWEAYSVVMHHRVGTLQIGEIAVIIVVATPHRAAAFEACQYAIDTLKETVPIWKKEIFEDGEVWVAAHP